MTLNRQELLLRALELSVQIKGPLSMKKRASGGTPNSELENYLPLAEAILDAISPIKSLPQTAKATKETPARPSNKELRKKGIGE